MSSSAIEPRAWLRRCDGDGGGSAQGPAGDGGGPGPVWQEGVIELNLEPG